MKTNSVHTLLVLGAVFVAILTPWQAKAATCTTASTAGNLLPTVCRFLPSLRKVVSGVLKQNPVRGHLHAGAFAIDRPPNWEQTRHPQFGFTVFISHRDSRPGITRKGDRP